ncbi:hypothetical protein B0H17DRAFT_1144270 [Mycena rosella]|uniref:Uncharacterized protein n=1 Tax=Mycena rosella TaxID=1033263 RepID=A0AAD7CTS9_MYCRO|nr:hypothetical protein B0H17DRAFT_1144270 [Mycena rosella]
MAVSTYPALGLCASIAHLWRRFSARHLRGPLTCVLSRGAVSAARFSSRNTSYLARINGGMLSSAGRSRASSVLVVPVHSSASSRRTYSTPWTLYCMNEGWYPTRLVYQRVASRRRGPHEQPTTSPRPRSHPPMHALGISGCARVAIRVRDDDDVHGPGRPAWASIQHGSPPVARMGLADALVVQQAYDAKGDRAPSGPLAPDARHCHARPAPSPAALKNQDLPRPRAPHARPLQWRRAPRPRAHLQDGATSGNPARTCCTASSPRPALLPAPRTHEQPEPTTPETRALSLTSRLAPKTRLASSGTDPAPPPPPPPRAASPSPRYRYRHPQPPAEIPSSRRRVTVLSLACCRGRRHPIADAHQHNTSPAPPDTVLIPPDTPLPPTRALHRAALAASARRLTAPTCRDETGMTYTPRPRSTVSLRARCRVARSRRAPAVAAPPARHQPLMQLRDRDGVAQSAARGFLQTRYYPWAYIRRKRKRGSSVYVRFSIGIGTAVNSALHCISFVCTPGLIPRRAAARNADIRYTTPPRQLQPMLPCAPPPASMCGRLDEPGGDQRVPASASADPRAAPQLTPPPRQLQIAIVVIMRTGYSARNVRPLQCTRTPAPHDYTGHPAQRPSTYVRVRRPAGWAPTEDAPSRSSRRPLGAHTDAGRATATPPPPARAQQHRERSTCVVAAWMSVSILVAGRGRSTRTKEYAGPGALLSDAHPTSGGARMTGADSDASSESGGRGRRGGVRFYGAKYETGGEGGAMRQGRARGEGSAAGRGLGGRALCERRGKEAAHEDRGVGTTAAHDGASRRRGGRTRPRRTAHLRRPPVHYTNPPTVEGGGGGGARTQTRTQTRAWGEAATEAEEAEGEGGQNERKKLRSSIAAACCDPFGARQSRARAAGGGGRKGGKERKGAGKERAGATSPLAREPDESQKQHEQHDTEEHEHDTGEHEPGPKHPCVRYDARGPVVVSSPGMRLRLHACPFACSVLEARLVVGAGVFRAGDWSMKLGARSSAVSWGVSWQELCHMLRDVLFEGKSRPQQHSQCPSNNLRRTDGEVPRVDTEVPIYLWWCPDALIALWTFGYRCSIPVIDLRRLAAILGLEAQA